MNMRVKGGREFEGVFGNQSELNFPFEMGLKPKRRSFVVEKGPGVGKPLGESLVKGGFEKGSRPRIQETGISQDPEDFKDVEWIDNT